MNFFFLCFYSVKSMIFHGDSESVNRILIFDFFRVLFLEEEKNGYPKIEHDNYFDN